MPTGWSFVQYITELRAVTNFGTNGHGDHVDRESVHRHIWPCRGDLRARGCRRHAPYQWLEDEGWLHHVGIDVLNELGPGSRH